MADQSTNDPSPATLVAIIVAAHRAGFRDLERETRHRLEREHGVRLTFAREVRGEAAHAR